MPATGRPARGALTGAAFLMAVSAIGPGFLTQTTQFTAQLGASLAFAILLSTLIDVGAQITTWRVLCASGRRGHEVAGAVVPGLGWVVAAVVVAGSFVFNIGNLAGCGLGLEAAVGLPPVWGIAGSAALAAGLFLLPRMLTAVDWFSKVLGGGMILVVLYVVATTAPPAGEAARAAVWPADVDPGVVVTLVGGTIGGYIMFSGAHRLIDAGVTGPGRTPEVTRAAVLGIVVAGLMRTLLFLAVLGVVAGGAELSRDRPVFDAFRSGAGRVGYVLSGLVFWAAAITSVVGCAYTSVSFLAPPGPDSGRRSWLIVGFVVLSTAATLGIREQGWSATRVLIAAGRVNGILLPVVFGAVLVAAYRRGVVGEYRHPVWAGAAGVGAWAATVGLAGWTVAALLR